MSAEGEWLAGAPLGLHELPDALLAHIFELAGRPERCACARRATRDGETGRRRRRRTPKFACCQTKGF